MALQTSVLEPAPGSSEESGILSDEQIEQLLHEAEARLKEASESTVQAAIASEHEDVISVGSIRKRKPYVCITCYRTDNNYESEDCQSSPIASRKRPISNRRMVLLRPMENGC